MKVFLQQLLNLARLSDIVIFFGGIDQTIEREVHDRLSIAFLTI
jgi:hypothetical protein